MNFLRYNYYYLTQRWRAFFRKRMQQNRLELELVSIISHSESLAITRGHPRTSENFAKFNDIVKIGVTVNNEHHFPMLLSSLTIQH